MRPRILLAVAWRDLRRVLAGRRLGLVGLALALILPAGALPVQRSGPEAPSVVAVQGEIPAPLVGSVVLQDGSPVRLSGRDPVIVTASSLPGSLRRELAVLEEKPSVTRILWRPELPLPGRNLLVALLAISLLTGPLAESLPGEREQGTLDALLSAAISRGELVGGKWLAWTAAASAVALLGGGAGLLTGAQEPGLWVLGVPLSVSVAVALGMWLVRRAGDALGGATAPMRVIPVVAVLLLSVSWWLSATSPILAAAVPLGGGLLLAGGMASSPLSVLAAALGSGAATAALLAGTAHALTTPARPRTSSGGLLLIGALAWWLPVQGPVVWGWAGRPELVEPQAGLAAGGALLLMAALTAAARSTALPVLRPLRLPGAAVGVGAGVLLAGLEHLGGGGLLPAGILTGALVVLGQELWFRGVLQARLGTLRAAVAWAVIVAPTLPIHGAISGAVLGLVSARCGVLSAVVAGAVWRVLA